MKILVNSNKKAIVTGGNAYKVRLPATLPVGATTVHTSASTTANYASNDNVRILGSDNKKYTLAEWNALFVAAGYDKTQMSVTPIGLSIDAFDNEGESYMFDRYDGRVYNPVGDSYASAGTLQHSFYNQNPITYADSGTDYTTNKAWTVTADGDEFILYTANTKQSWRQTKNMGYVNQHEAFNPMERTLGFWAENEWMRHRMAIASGVTTTKADGTMGEIAIYNSSGTQAAVSEDMYFWIKNDSNVWTNTNILAKYNLNNLHGGSSYQLTTTIRDAIYARQIANGINMNDTGVNSSSKPVLAPGSKGAEVIAVDGEWMIITPFITRANTTTSSNSNNMADSPAVYWAVGKGYCLPSDTLLLASYFNRTIVNAVISYLNTVETRDVLEIPTSNTWSIARYAIDGAWFIRRSNGVVDGNGTTAFCNIVGSKSPK